MTSTWNFRRYAGRTVAVAAAGALLSGLAVSQASASSLGDLQAQAAAIEAHISSLGYQESALSERYDEAEGDLAQLRKQVSQARAEVATANGRAAKAKQVLSADAIDAYLDNGEGSLAQSGGSSTVGGADSSLLRIEYEQTLASNQTDAEDQYKLASRQANTAEANLTTQEAAAAANVRTISADQRQLQSTASSLESVEAQDKGRIAQLIAQQQAAQQAAEQRAANARLAAEQAAAAAAARTTTTTAPSPAAGPVTTPTTVASGGGGGYSAPTPAPTGGESSVAAAAVAAAESRVGDPYVYGAAGPDSFDCSGLVMWAYAQAGVSLPHFSGAQYADTTHISMDDLEPGDLLFFSDPDIHVAMYVGDGDIIQAPYTGADVQIVPIYSELTLATRVA